ncbi:MAG: efflux RND transporter periplasmic adaptor subunit [FCB group bacterium]|nr:efflux RND transporter periplasmic adaptor subunit [FCB group bacterium]
MKLSNWSKLLPFLIIVGAVAIFVFMTLLRPKPVQFTQEIPLPGVKTITLTGETLNFHVSGSGSVSALDQVTLISQVGGTIQRVSPGLRTGTAVKKGELLIQIDTTDYHLQVQSADANVSKMELALEMELEESSIAQLEWDLYTGNKKKTEPTDLVLRRSQLELAAANLKAAVATLQLAENNLNRTRITAPFDGIIMDKSVSPGQYISPGSRLGSIFATRAFEIKIPLTEAELARLQNPVDSSGRKTQIPVKITSGSPESEAHWSGYLDRFEGFLDAQTRMIEAVVVVPKPYEYDSPLYLGMYVKVEIPGKSLQNVYKIPNAAIRADDTIWIARESRLLIRKIKPLWSDEEFTYSLNSIHSGEKLIISSLNYAVEGMQITAAGN